MRHTIFLALLVAAPLVRAQTAPPDRVRLYGEPKWISGGNVAWVNFSADVGPGDTNLARFREAFRQVHEAGGNSMRLWLHTNGAVTPAWSASAQGAVTGPGVGTIDDIRAILDIAEDEEIGVQLCLWSFDMLRTSYGSSITGRARALLTSAALTQTYIDTALTPMVNALKDHRAILSWEIFNEPEGMTTEFGFGGIVSSDLRVPMTDIQRFTNQLAGAIHRADPEALVTNGSVNMRTLSDVLTGTNEFNYYRDDRLVAAGGDPLGTLDVYEAHYYTNNVPSSLSPFNHDASYWGVTKPLVIAEFFASGDVPPSTSVHDLYTTLYDRGYAGALVWQFIESPIGQSATWTGALENMATMFRLHRDAVDVVVPGPDVIDFTATPAQILVGASSTLAWTVEEATGVTINGASVPISGTLAVSPTEPTDYVLVASDAAGLTETRTVTVDVRTDATVNRALGRPTTASSGEAGTGNAAPGLAVDGNLGTRWSSAWDLAANPEPDNEFIAVDLGAAYDVTRVLLTWEAAYGKTYDIQTSLDGQTWTAVREVCDGDGGLDDLAIAGAARARFVRMLGFTRGTRFGFSLFEFEVNGLRSAQQPPAVALTSPAAGTVDLGTTLAVSASATDADGTVPAVNFYVGETLLASAVAAPYTTTWTPAVGTYTLTAVATDTDGTRVRSAPVVVVVEDPDAIVRYEAEAGRLVGGTAVEALAGASGGQVVTLYDASDVGITWTVDAPSAGTYPVTVRYALPFGPQSQNLVVNGTATAVSFAGSDGSLRSVMRDVALNAGANEVRLEAGSGFMSVDYLEVVVIPPTAGEAGAPAAELALGQAFPNPATNAATVPYTMASSGPVRLAVYDALGRRVALLVDGVVPAGEHRAPFSAGALAGGVYVVRLEADGQTRTRRLVVTR